MGSFLLIGFPKNLTINFSAHRAASQSWNGWTTCCLPLCLSLSLVKIFKQYTLTFAFPRGVWKFWECLPDWVKCGGSLCFHLSSVLKRSFSDPVQQLGVRLFGQKGGALSQLRALPPISLRAPVLPGWGLHFEPSCRSCAVVRERLSNYLG